MCCREALYGGVWGWRRPSFGDGLGAWHVYHADTMSTRAHPSLWAPFFSSITSVLSDGWSVRGLLIGDGRGMRREKWK